METWLALGYPYWQQLVNQYGIDGAIQLMVQFSGFGEAVIRAMLVALGWI